MTEQEAVDREGKIEMYVAKLLQNAGARYNPKKQSWKVNVSDLPSDLITDLKEFNGSPVVGIIQHRFSRKCIELGFEYQSLEYDSGSHSLRFSDLTVYKQSNIFEKIFGFFGGVFSKN